MKLLCAGPTSIDPQVMEIMGQSKTNPDLDPEYTKIHRNVEKKLSDFLKTKETTFLMLGEAIMGLEGAISSLMEPKERVLVLHNGYFGIGFSDYVQRYGGEAVELAFDYRQGIDVDQLEDFLKKDHDFSIATLVHCETPSGITNDISKICPLLHSYGILSVVDSVSGIGGEEVDFDRDQVDVLIGGSQKCLSAPVGLTTITVSQRAKEKINQRKSKIAGYYLNFENYYNYKDSFDFPYTMNENLTYAFDKALDLLIGKDSLRLHKKYGEETRQILTNSGLELYPKNSWSNTVTTVLMPEGYDSRELLEKMRKRDIIISGGMGDILKTTFRIGHMGNNIDEDNFKLLYEKLDDSFLEMGITLKIPLLASFNAIHKPD
ncbi:MAG: alanine--glyoxylate aminotransferase family protein [Tissierellia bacterium]|nr:alanine--glyoxylate aminotransferase family protein [Tissierellia bacterium]